MRVEREVLDLFLLQIFCVEWFQRHAVITHSLLSMPAHLDIPFAGNFAVQLVKSVIQGGLFDHFPWVLNFL